MSKNKRKYASESAAARFMSTVHDELLREILIRLPRMGPAITVCRNWHSLIISDHPYAFLSHTLHHHHRRQRGYPDPSYTPPCTLLIGYEPTEPCVEILCDKSKILDAALSRQSPQRNLLGFASSLNSASIKSSFNDLLLIDLNGRYCIYNVVTREQRLLPDPPPESIADVKSILVGREEPNGKLQFRVLRFPASERTVTKHVTVFSSETGEWSDSELNLDRPCTRDPTVSADGAIHWRKLRFGIVVYDPFRPPNNPSSCRIVEYPFEMSIWQASFFRAVWNIWIGAVRGRLRLLDAEFEEKDIRLTIWELDDEDKWSLVRRVPLKRGTVTCLTMVAFHPDDGDVIFVMPRGTTVYRCELKTKRLFEEVGQVSIDLSIDAVTHHIRYFSLVTSWF